MYGIEKILTSDSYLGYILCWYFSTDSDIIAELATWAKDESKLAKDLPQLNSNLNKNSTTLADFFQNTDGPYLNPIIRDNTHKYRHYKLGNSELLRCIHENGSKKDRKQTFKMNFQDVKSRIHSYFP